ncbi:MAG: DMT family transporter [Acidimicrobiales bacterium]
MRARLWAVLAIAIVAISSSAILVRWADASPIALAFWRTLGGALVLAPAAARAAVRPTKAQWVGIGLAGVALGAHFATWLASLELTSIAASVTLVATVPLIVAVALALTGRPPGSRTWLAIVLAIAGTLIITLGDIDGGGSGRSPLIGNGLALIGAATMAFYLITGDRLRTSLSTAAYASRTYAVAAATMLAVALIGGVDLIGYDRRTWLAVLGMIIGPQLAGHTALNFLLGQLGSVSVSLALLAEPLGATILAWLAFRELPPLAAAFGAPLVIIGVAIHIVNDSGSSSPSFDRKGQG